MHKRKHFSIIVCILTLFLSALSPALARQSKDKKDEKKDEKKKPEPFKIEKHTQGMGLYTFGPVSPDKKTILLVAKKPESAPNLYRMDLADYSIQTLTQFPWGIADPQWSPDGTSVAFAGFNETASFSDLYTLDLKNIAMRRLTSNNFSDKQPVFAPDGKRIFFTTDESPLPDAAFGTLHVAVVQTAGGKPEYFTEDEVSSILPGLAADGKSLMLVKVDDLSGRHSLWQYGFDGKPMRDLTERKFARIHRYIQTAANRSDSHLGTGGGRAAGRSLYPRHEERRSAPGPRRRLAEAKPCGFARRVAHSVRRADGDGSAPVPVRFKIGPAPATH